MIRSSVIRFGFVTVSFLVLVTCEKPERFVQISTEKVPIEISYTSVLIKGEITDLGSKPIDDHGIMISENSNPRVGNARVESLGSITSKGPFEVTITGLTKNTLYYFRAFVTVDGTDIFSEQTYSFKTKDTETASVSAGVLSDTTMVSARLNGEVTADGGEAVSKRGLVWSLSAEPTLASCMDTTINGSGKGAFTAVMTELTPGTKYYVRAYATNAKGTSYSPSDIIFTTHKLPVVTTSIVTNVTNTGAASGGEVTDDGGVPVLARGIVWSTSSPPVISLATKIENGKGTGSFTGSISGLIPGATYFIRAYATNKYGTSYGNEVQVTSTKPSDATTLAATIIGNTVATLNGSVNANNFSSNISFEYGTTTSYGTTVDASPKTATGSSATSVSADISGLAPGTEYHFRIRSVNVGGETLGGDLTFSTTDSPIPVTLAPTSVANTSVTLDGSVNANNSETSASFEYGLTTAYGSSATATPGIINGSSSTTVSAALTGLTQGTIYHYRVRAISVGGTSYGEDMTFRTTQPPDAITDDATSILNNGAVLNGSVNANDLETAITFEFGTSTTYGTSVSASQGTSTGNNSTSVAATLSGLTAGVQYHFRVKAVSVAGTSYGSDKVFTTLQTPAATTVTASSVTNTTATLNGTASANGSTTTVTFEYGLTTSYGLTVTASQSPVTEQSAPVSITITGLTPGATYHYRVVATSPGGTANGGDQTFTTTQPPDAVTDAATSIGPVTTTLNATVNAKGLSTVVIFEYGTTTAYGQTATVSVSPVTGSTNTPVSATISSLSASTTYHYRVKAESAGGIGYGDDATVTTTASLSITDYDGNIYNTVQIGSQTWLKENLRTTHYFNGDAIPILTENGLWISSTSGALCWYNNESLYKQDYGALYNYYSATDTRNICPSGWHVASLSDWQILFDNVGGEGYARYKLSEEGILHWHDPNSGATNEVGFTALPGGIRFGDGSFGYLSIEGLWWTTTESSSYNPWVIYMSFAASAVSKLEFGKNSGSSVRCIKGVLPLAQTISASAISSESVTLNAKINPNTTSTIVTFEYGTSTSYGNETPAIQSPVTGNLSIDVNSSLTGLTPNATYHYRVKAVNSGGISFGSDITFLTPPIVSDIDGNTYNSVQIGSQIWMKEHLKTTKLNDGTLIPYAPVDVDWRYLGTPAYCWPANNTANKTLLGGIYNWHVVNTNKICPTGWHIPTSTEFNTLITSLGGSSVAGGKLKSLTSWNSPNTGATNSSNFEAKSAGMRDRDGAFLLFGVAADFWCKDQYNTEQAWIFQLSNNSAAANTSNYFFPAGMSIRCIKD